MRRVATEDDLKRVKARYNEAIRSRPKMSWHGIDNFIANCCQNLTNYALARAYKKLGLFRGIPCTTKVRGKAYARKRGLPF